MSGYQDGGFPRIGLAEAIRQLRAELSQARAEGEGEAIRFAAKTIEIELGIDFGWTREAEGGLKIFSFLDLSGKAGSEEKSSHKLKLSLEIADPSDPKTKHQEIKGKSPPMPGG